MLCESCWFLAFTPLKGLDFTFEFAYLCCRLVFLVFQFLEKFFHLGTRGRVFLYNRVIGEQGGLVLILCKLVVEGIVFISQLYLFVCQLQLLNLFLLFCRFTGVRHCQEDYGQHCHYEKGNQYHQPAA